MKKGFSVTLLILSIVALLGIAGGAYYLGKKSSSPLVAPPATTKTAVSPSLELSSQAKLSPLFSGTIKQINKDLGIFKITDVDKENGVPDSIAYYEAGTFLRGEFAGYTRILAIRPSEGPGPSLQYILATKDYASYLLDDPMGKTVNYPESDWDNPYLYIDKSKIAKTVTLDSDHPKTIDVTKPYKLIREDSVLLEYKKTGKKDKNGYDISIDAPLSSFDASFLLPSAQAQLSLYAGGTDWSNSQPQNEKEKTALATRNQYLHKTTSVHGVDSTGLAYTYIVAFASDVDTYISNSSSRETTNIAYKKQVALYNDKKIKEYPISPDVAPFPGLRFSKSSAGLAPDFYSSYDSAFPGACGGNTNTYIVDSITDADLTSVPSSANTSLFTLKDAKHPLNDLAYQVKADQGEESFKAVNGGSSLLSFADYVAKHPLLFLKDAWGRWAVVGEYDLKLMGGCGKPVVYLYPEKLTTVHLSFSSPIELNTNIPSYHEGWLVSASPNGVLTDLQPQYTNCSQIDAAKFGSEYAQSACKSNSYPYIYWSGKSVEKSYPTGSDGWIVTKENLKTFMQNKLKDIGLTDKESGDMIAYWVPKMNEKQAPYYQIRFIQTKEMNDFVPMQVNPRPDSILRVFLDWKALSNKPAVNLAPQQLKKMERNGFTLVEWGGLR